MMIRKKIAAANWKMNLTLTQANELLDNMVKDIALTNLNHEVVFAVPFPYISAMKEKIKSQKNIFIAAQNCYSKKSGAYTGEISAEMLASVGVDFVVLGHSERREYFVETNAQLTEKMQLVLDNKMKVIFCCGEPLHVREANQQNEFVHTQIQESLFAFTPEQLTQIVIAYEPIWAIGTGKTATTEQAEDIHQAIRAMIEKKYGTQVAQKMSILYGGSVKANNAKELFACANIDGGLVGGASLIAAEFLPIIKALPDL